MRKHHNNIAKLCDNNKLRNGFSFYITDVSYSRKVHFSFQSISLYHHVIFDLLLHKTCSLMQKSCLLFSQYVINKISSRLVSSLTISWPLSGGYAFYISFNSSLVDKVLSFESGSRKGSFLSLSTSPMIKTNTGLSIL